MNWKSEGRRGCIRPNDLEKMSSGKQGEHWENERILMRGTVEEGRASVR